MMETTPTPKKHNTKPEKEILAWAFLFMNMNAQRLLPYLF